MLLIEYVRTVSILCLTIFGCAGNILTLIIVNQRFFRKTSSAAFISGLSIADCFVLCLHSLQILTKLQPQVTSYDCLIFYFIDVFRLLSVWIVCLINIERCSLVFNPCHLPRLRSPVKARIIVLILFICSLLIFSHYSQHMYIHYVYRVNQTAPIRSLCMFNEGFHQLTWQYIQSSLTYWLIVPVCIICNCLIIKRLRQASQIERTLNKIVQNKLDLSNKQHQLTAMLVASSICFILTSTPFTIHSIYLLLTANKDKLQYTIHILMNILLHIHHASNFLVFLFSCRRFRLELMNLLHRCFHCEIFLPWNRRSTANTEQIVIYSTKNQRTPVKLFTQKSQQQWRSSPNKIIVLTTNNNNQRKSMRNNYRALYK